MHVEVISYVRLLSYMVKSKVLDDLKNPIWSIGSVTDRQPILDILQTLWSE